MSDVERRVLHWLRGRVRILDAGCGECDFPTDRRGFVAGIDSDVRRIEAGKARGILGLEVGSVTDLPYLDDTFDGVLAHEVVEHLSYGAVVAFLREAERVLVPGGLLVMSTWERCPDIFWTHAEHVRPYPAKALVKLAQMQGLPMQQVGFERVGWRGVHGLLVMGRS